MSWLGELKSLCDFTLYLGKVCSPGPATDSELIVAYMGLYWLFADCATIASNEGKQDLDRQAQKCQTSLEATLSSLGFHIPTTIDSVLAMYLAVSSFYGSDLSDIYQGLTKFIGSLLLSKREDIYLLGLYLKGITPCSSTGVAKQCVYDRRHCRGAAPQVSPVVVYLFP